MCERDRKPERREDREGRRKGAKEGRKTKTTAILKKIWFGTVIII